MTPREKDVYDFIVSYWTMNNGSPTFQEIGMGVGLKPVSTVHKYVSSLVQKGALQHTQGTMRALIPVGYSEKRRIG